MKLSPPPRPLPLSICQLRLCAGGGGAREADSNWSDWFWKAYWFDPPPRPYGGLSLGLTNAFVRFLELLIITSCFSIFKRHPFTISSCFEAKKKGISQDVLNSFPHITWAKREINHPRPAALGCVQSRRVVATQLASLGPSRQWQHWLCCLRRSLFGSLDSWWHHHFSSTVLWWAFKHFTARYNQQSMSPSKLCK